MNNYCSKALLCGLFICTANFVSALTLEELENQTGITPKGFAKLFRGFKYEYFPAIRDPELFLFSKRGDCDDYATLADRILRRAGYHTRLISIKIAGAPSHVVCYIEEERGYLDFNNRENFFPIENCGPTLNEIARKVAQSFSANWTSATEFLYEGPNVKTPIKTLAKTDWVKEAVQNQD